VESQQPLPSHYLLYAPAGTSLELYKPSPALVDSYRALGILAPDMPAPVGMLAHLWKVPEQEALLRAQQFRDAGVMRIAQLDDGSFWCLVTPDHLARAQVGGRPFSVVIGVFQPLHGCLR
jgi:hypothetical protein